MCGYGKIPMPSLKSPLTHCESIQLTHTHECVCALSLFITETLDLDVKNMAIFWFNVRWFRCISCSSPRSTVTRFPLVCWAWLWTAIPCLSRRNWSTMVCLQPRRSFRWRCRRRANTLHWPLSHSPMHHIHPVVPNWCLALATERTPHRQGLPVNNNRM